jgi:hypothetical protein
MMEDGENIIIALQLPQTSTRIPQSSIVSKNSNLIKHCKKN